MKTSVLISGSNPLLADGPVEEECPVGLGEDWCPDFRLRGSGVEVRTPRIAWGRSPFCYEISQDLAFDCMAGLEVQLELSQLCCPLGDVARGVGVVQDRSQRVRGHYDNSVCLKIMAQFPGRNKYGIDKLMRLKIPSLCLMEDFADVVD